MILLELVIIFCMLSFQSRGEPPLVSSEAGVTFINTLNCDILAKSENNLNIGSLQVRKVIIILKLEKKI